MTDRTKNFPLREMEILEEWAVSKIRKRGVPPWAWYRLWQLRDAIDGCRRSFNATSQAEVDLRELEKHQDASLPQQGKVVELKTPQRRRDIAPIDLPM